MIQIPYMIRTKLSTTTYTEIHEDDMENIKAILLKVAAVICEGSNSKTEDGKDAFARFITVTEKLPRGRNNMNSIASYTGGLINNLVFGEQRDFTERQLIAIEYITKELHSVVPEIPQVRFRLGLIR